MSRIGRLLLAGLTAGLVLTACTDPRPGERPGEEPAAVEFHSFDAGTVRLEGEGWASALAASRAVFAHAPLVYLTDGDALETAQAEADGKQAPVLVAPEAEADRAAIAEELERLGATHVVTVGSEWAPEGQWLVREYDPDAPEEDQPAPEVTAAPAPRGVAMLVTGADQDGAAAVAEAAGIPVMRLDDADLQRSADAIEFLSSQDPTTVITAGEAFAEDDSLDWRIAAARTGYQLPGGGQNILGGRQYVALYGSPGTSVLGALGHQGLDATVERVKGLSAEYQELTDAAVVPSFELIVTVASAHAGPDGNYSNELPVEEFVPWIERAGEEGIKVILDLQPGRTDFLTQAKEYEELLKYPHVGLALDPEWRLKENQVHLVQIGTVTIEEVNKVSTWLADLVRDNDLPPKLLVLHQFRISMITDRADLDMSRPEVEHLIHVDGQGTQPAKQETWGVLKRDAPEGIGWGWKNFYEKDLPMLTPQQTMTQVDPVPDLVTYQ